MANCSATALQLMIEEDMRYMIYTSMGSNVSVSAGVWLLVRCADLEGLGYSVTAFWACLGVLLGLGAFWRLCAAVAMLTLHRDKCR